jgi:spore germination protein GerM
MIRKWASLVLAIFLVVGACRRPERPSSNLVLANKIAPRDVTLFFESSELLLVPETRTLQLPQNEAAALSTVLRELVKGSANASIPRLLPEDAVVRATYLLPDGTAIVDLGGPSLTDGWNTGSHGELMAIYSIVQTLAVNFPTVRRVRMVVNGQPAETLAGHIRIDRALRPMPSLLKQPRM